MDTPKKKRKVKMTRLIDSRVSRKVTIWLLALLVVMFGVFFILFQMKIHALVG